MACLTAFIDASEKSVAVIILSHLNVFINLILGNNTKKFVFSIQTSSIPLLPFSLSLSAIFYFSINEIIFQK
jgi:hypothetical protein